MFYMNFYAYYEAIFFQVSFVAVTVKFMTLLNFKSILQYYHCYSCRSISRNVVANYSGLIRFKCTLTEYAAKLCIRTNHKICTLLMFTNNMIGCNLNFVLLLQVSQKM